MRGVSSCLVDDRKWQEKKKILNPQKNFSSQEWEKNERKE